MSMLIGEKYYRKDPFDYGSIPREEGHRVLIKQLLIEHWMQPNYLHECIIKRIKPLEVVQKIPLSVDCMQKLIAQINNSQDNTGVRHLERAIIWAKGKEEGVNRTVYYEY